MKRFIVTALILAIGSMGSLTLPTMPDAYASTVVNAPYTLLNDGFDGSSVRPCYWHIPTWVSPTDGTYVGRTQFRCCQNSPLPAAVNGNAMITVETYNPTGFSFYGTDLISNHLLTLGQGIHITVRARMNTSTRGIVGGIFLYALKPGSATLHDEIDFELVTNRPDGVQTNIYSNASLGRGDPEFVSYPGVSKSITDYHIYEIEWLPGRASWYIDGQLVRTETNNVPSGPMYFHLNMWVPDEGWAEAYDAALQPTPSPGSNQIFSMSVDSVNIESMGVSAHARQLISHYYQHILRRTPDPDGQAYWEGEITRMQGCGSDLKEVFRVIAKKFFGSTEYIDPHKADDEFVTDLYRTFFNRDPDPSGFDFWTAQLAAGLPRDAVMDQFLFSPEFKGFMEGLFGDTTVRAEINMVGDFYRGLLGRLPDNSGFCDWLDQFLIAQCRGDESVRQAADSISKLFLDSKEYDDLDRSNEEFVQDLYCAFLRRGTELGGFLFWVDQLDKGILTREQARQCFVAAPEFQDRVQQVIAEGCNKCPTHR